ncbi:hypothetical protein EST92_25615 [Streptomyces sp. TM32]|uniref:hypothetical protein n=1 Tax=Streptomyces sp. TM32 TaxID=1652669 RepID=UPI001010D325|nr:hypothetical protein [Streptomyces sp. TM32]RXS69392.1 hypothetical protein EST92_25615 [Streptomyces sp. TM32]
MRKQLRAELSMLRHDYILAGALAFLAIPALGTVSGLPDTAGAPDEALFRLARGQLGAAMVTLVVLAAVYGSARFTNSYRTGAVARSVLIGPRTEVLWCKAASAAVGGALIGLAGTTVLAVILRLGTGDTGLSAGTVPGAVGASASAAVWGVLLGSLIKHHLVAFFAVPTSLLVAVPLAGTWPHGARLLPLGGQLALTPGTTGPWPSPQCGAATVAVWLIAAGALARARFRSSDL